MQAAKGLFIFGINKNWQHAILTIAMNWHFAFITNTGDSVLIQFSRVECVLSIYYYFLQKLPTRFFSIAEFEFDSVLITTCLFQN